MTAKIADFGLSVKIDHHETHVSMQCHLGDARALPLPPPSSRLGDARALPLLPPSFSLLGDARALPRPPPSFSLVGECITVV